MKWCFRVNNSAEYSMELPTSLYIEAAAAALAIVGNVTLPAQIEVWALYDLNAYLYLAKDDGCGNLTIGPAIVQVTSRS